MQLGWIDFSKTERSKILGILDNLTEAGTLDELGIAAIRDGFADIFFPGTSTIQTRAKYFFIVLYGLLKVLEKETDPKKVLSEFDNVERRCAERFLELNPDDDGIIGRRTLSTEGKWLKRTPAYVYWAGLRTYGIFNSGIKNLSLSAYVKNACALRKEKLNSVNLGNADENSDADDLNADGNLSVRFWNGVSTPADDWIENLEMRLTKTEAQTLKNKIIENCKDSLLAYILRQDNSLIKEIVSCNSFQEFGNVLQRHNFPQNLVDEYNLALQFSSFVYILRCFYNVIVSQGNKISDNQAFEEYRKHEENIRSLNLDMVIEQIESKRSKQGYLPLSDNLKNFVKSAHRLLTAQTLDSEGIKKCISNREKDLKGSARAKTLHPNEYNSDSWIGGKELDYRFRNAMIIVKDIIAGLEDVNA